MLGELPKPEGYNVHYKELGVPSLITPEYIELCKLCESLQGKYWIPMQMDVVALAGCGDDVVSTAGECYMLGFLVAAKASRDEMNQPNASKNEYLFAQSFSSEAPLNQKGNSYSWSDNTFNKHSWIFLPRLDQYYIWLSNNSDVTWDWFLRECVDVYKTCKDNNYYTDMLCCALHLYMHLRHHTYWFQNLQKWVEVPDGQAISFMEGVQ